MPSTLLPADADDATQYLIKWPKERKPTTEHVMQDGLVLAAAVVLLNSFVVDLLVDFMSYFWQHKLHPMEWWSNLIVWHDAETDKPVFLANAVMNMGNSGSADEMDAREAVYFVYALRREDVAVESGRSQSRPLREWLTLRNTLLITTARNEARLYNIKIYMDDPRLSAVGPDRLARLARCFHAVVQQRLGLLMAVMEKVDIGVSTTWIGHIHCSANAVMVMQEQKALRAIEILQKALMENGQVTAQEWSDNLQLLQHLAWIRARDKQAFYGLWSISKDLQPGAKIPCTRVQRWKSVIEAWIDALARTPVVPYATVFHSTAMLQGCPQQHYFVVQTDAAKEGAVVPAMGFFVAGMYGVVPFSKEDLRAAIPVLELLTICRFNTICDGRC
mmetsp:Transcript_14836/g.19689  ORF Transcript_14836/g.19689 Transcript_14836/m.19689 type:complete len:389 (+) Transcript_14836:230-1396(+)